MSAASPTPSNMPPPPANLKRSRASGAGPSASQGSTGARTKRRKPEPGSDEGDLPTKKGTGKGKEEETVDPTEVKTKIDFNDLPVETLYKYLEYHDLLPRWDVSPWSEEPCTPPNQLYTLSSTAPIIPPPSTIAPQVQLQEPSQIEDASHVIHTDTALPQTSAQYPNPENTVNVGITSQSSENHGLNQPMNTHDDPLPQLPPTSSDQIPSVNEISNKQIDQTILSENPEANPVEPKVINNAPEIKNGEEEEEEEEVVLDNFEPPTTRSKTLPIRRQTSPEILINESIPQIKRGVITLSDVRAAKEVLAEKANNHWMKGLGGGQNKEGETIVHFLYKMKVGQGRLLRVYNPAPANQSS
ncbi:uncharacterized protein I206_105567 [Kwoniella pini CBS 10737]|uniref:Uncharacterized protein n=1 Tax=Kwoniella pini CBS 10737 TaxID=1296096 RepID=A0A1B9I3Z6_9TREE|nr:uncharacterized protein I206_03530 [Kwoniella pini CBS 10737]OCF50211.1 hypothetical protein I206_03530 [Kwoniella pini CBS 10737]